MITRLREQCSKFRNPRPIFSQREKAPMLLMPRRRHEQQQQKCALGGFRCFIFKAQSSHTAVAGQGRLSEPCKCLWEWKETLQGRKSSCFASVEESWAAKVPDWTSKRIAAPSQPFTEHFFFNFSAAWVEKCHSPNVWLGIQYFEIWRWWEHSCATINEALEAMKGWSLRKEVLRFSLRKGVVRGHRVCVLSEHVE